MKKALLSLAVIAAFSMSAYAETEISLAGLTWTGWGGSGSSFDGVNTLTFDAEWKGGQFDLPEAVNATGHDYIVYEIAPASVNAKLTLKGWWGDGMTISYNYSSGNTRVVGRIDDEWAAGMYRIQQLQFQGSAAGDLIINKISLLTAEEAIAAGIVKPTVAVEMPLSYGPHVLLSEFVDLDDDTEIDIKVSNNTNPYVSRNGWGIGYIVPINLWEGYNASFSLDATDGKEFTITCHASDLKTVALNGGSEYYSDSYSQQGVTFMLYNDCSLVSVSKMATASYIRMASAGIQSYVPTADLDFSKTEGITAYVVPQACTVGEPVTSISLQEVEQVKAGTPVFIVGAAGEPYNVLEVSGVSAVVDNVLAVGDGITTCGSDAYGINKNTGNLAPITPGSVIPEGIVYIPSLAALTASGSASDARMSVGFDSTSAIQTLKQESVVTKSFDLFGRQSQAGQGFQIHNGKISVVR